MSSTDDDIGNTDHNDAVLRQGLRAEPLPAAAMARIRKETEAQWRATTASAVQPRRWGRYASAAAVTLVVMGSILFLRGFLHANAGTTIGRVAHVDPPGALEVRRWLPDRPIASGAALHAGQHLMARGGARIELAGSASLRLAAGADVEFSAAQLVRLIDGNLYLDIPPAPGAPLDLSVQTPAGTFTHVGTQFQLFVHDGRTELQVREGQVRWHSGRGDVLADRGTQLSIDARGEVTRTTVAATAASWNWTEALAGSFSIEDRSLADFLHYIARETGRGLVYSSAAAESRATTTTLHGSIDGLVPLDALSTIMSTTSLRFTLGADSIRIESGGDSGQTSK